MDTIVLIIGALIVVSLIVGNIIYSNKMKKEAIAARPKDNRIYKVFEITYDDNKYYVVKSYHYHSMDNAHSWILYGEYLYYNGLTKQDVISLCDRLNDKHIEELNKKKMTRMLENTSGNIIH